MTTNIYMTEQKNQFRNVCQVGIDHVCIGNTYRASTARASAIFIVRDQADIDRMKSWIEYWS